MRRNNFRFLHGTATYGLSAYGIGGFHLHTELVDFFFLQHAWVNGYLAPPTLLIVCKHVMSYHHGSALGQGSLIRAAT